MIDLSDAMLSLSPRSAICRRIGLMQMSSSRLTSSHSYQAPALSPRPEHHLLQRRTLFI